MVNLVNNGNFASAGASPDLDPTGWTTTETATNGAQVVGGELHFNSAGGPLGSSIAQTVTGTPIGETVNFSFNYNEVGTGLGSKNIRVTIRNGNGVIVYTQNIDVAGAYSASFVATTNNYTITFLDTSTGGAGSDPVIDNVVFDVPFVVCFLRGTMIATPAGEVAVEDLRVGDMVLTRDNGAQKIRWLAKNSVDGSANLAPILIKAGALGNDRDLYVSPQHRMLVSDWRAELLFGETEVLVAAKHLVNDSTILRAPAPAVEYFHFMFDRHQLVRANGAWSESFFPGSFALRAIASGPRDELFAVFPELRHRTGSFGLAARFSPKPAEARLLRV